MVFSLSFALSLSLSLSFSLSLSLSLSLSRYRSLPASRDRACSARPDLGSQGVASEFLYLFFNLIFIRTVVFICTVIFICTVGRALRLFEAPQALPLPGQNVKQLPRRRMCAFNAGKRSREKHR